MVSLDVMLLEKGRYNRDLTRPGADETLGYFSFSYLENREVFYPANSREATSGNASAVRRLEVFSLDFDEIKSKT